MTNWVSSHKASKIVGVTSRTLRNWNSKGLVSVTTTPTGGRLYDLDSIFPKSSDNTKPKTEVGEQIVYARVSSRKQKEDLERQVKLLAEQFPQHRVIRDIGSGINFKRPGLRSVLRLCIEGSLRELVVAHKDRLSRIAFDLIEFFIKECGGTVVVLGRGEGDSPADELGEDLLSIVHVFSCRHYGRRKYPCKSPHDEERPRKRKKNKISDSGGERSTLPSEENTVESNS